MPAVSLVWLMASAAVLWETLRDRGIADVAPLFVRAEVFSLSAVQGSWQRLLDVGVQRWQLELLAAGSDGSVLLLPQWRADQPPVRKRQRASLQEALLAGEPSNRALALEELDREVLAKTTMGPYESRLLVWRRICAQWEVPAFPLDERNVRAVAASLKRGRYRSSEQYFFCCGFVSGTTTASVRAVACQGHHQGLHPISAPRPRPVCFEGLF